MEFTVLQIAQILGGQVEGNGDLKVNNLAKIQEATSGTISFLSNPKYEPFVYETNATAVIVSKDFVPKENIKPALIRVADPYSAFSVLLEEYYKLHTFRKNGVEAPAYIGENSTVGDNIYRGAFSYIGIGCKIGNNVKIYPQAYIGDNVIIGNNSIIYAGAKIYPGTLIGNHCTIQAGAVIGSDGFGFAPQPDGTYKAVPQVGNVVLEDHVDIGANTVIDCATMGSTIIRKGVKLDNLIQIAHNVDIGENTVIAAQAGISGSSKIGENCMIGGQVGIVGHITIAKRTNIGAQSGISKSIKQEGKSFSGSPSNELKQQLKYYTIFKKLPEMLKRIEELEEKVIHLFPFEN